VFDTIASAFTALFGKQPTPPQEVVLFTALLALLFVVPRPAWLLSRGFVTIAHEGGHALLAVLSGRRLSGIRLHSDTSGLTLWRGKPTGPGMVLTLFAGYTTPALIGLLGAALLQVGRVTLLLWICLGLLPAMLVMIRNVYGVASVVIAMATIFAVAWFAPPVWKSLFAYEFVWFLLFGAIRPVYELLKARWRRREPNSDADQLGRLTRVPATIWVFLFAAVNLGALWLGASWLVDGSLFAPLADLVNQAFGG
jgi:hypothetical protein